MHRREEAHSVPSIIWGLAIATYICLCGLSIFFITKRETKYNFGIFLLAQGVLLSVMTLQAGVAFLSWIGLVVFLIGLFLSFFYATQGGSAPAIEQTATDHAAAELAATSVNNVLNRLALPICYCDSKGFVAGATNMFFELTDRMPEEVLGEPITRFLPVDEPDITLESGKWWITQVKEGARHYFMLHPTKDGMPAPEVKQPKQTAGGGAMSIIDPATGLYTDQYRQLRGPEEVSRAQRYKRVISGMLLELIFDISSGITLLEEQRNMLNIAFAAKVKTALRTMDCGFWMDDHKRIQLLLPETPQGGAKTLMSRLLLLPQEVFEEDIRGMLNPKVKIGMFFYNGTSKMEYSIFSATLEESFNNAKEGAAPVSNAAA